jgi:hypothetical protein
LLLPQHSVPPGPMAQEVAGRFVADAPEGEGVVGQDGAVLLDEEELVVGLVGRQEADAREVEAEAVDGAHAEGGVLVGVVLVLDPAGEVAVEGVDGGQVEGASEEAHADRAEETLDLGGAVADRGVAEQAADAGADLGDLLAGVDGAVVDVEGVGDTIIVMGSAGMAIGSRALGAGNDSLQLGGPEHARDPSPGGSS